MLSMKIALSRYFNARIEVSTSSTADVPPMKSTKRTAPTHRGTYSSNNCNYFFFITSHSFCIMSEKIWFSTTNSDSKSVLN
jgi:hypothetical protein